VTLPQHSPVGFSSRKRWSECPGSIKLSEGIPSRSSKFADEGTAAHALQEYCLRKGTEAIDMIGTDLAYEDHGVDKAFIVTDEMATHIQDVLTNIRCELLEDLDYELLVEERFHLHQLHKDLFGTGDVAIWFPKARKLQVRDLKYGAGVAVEIEDEDGEANVQLEGYALGALLKFPEWKPVEVEIVIDQPRAFHADGATRRKTLPVSYFVDMAADLVDEVNRTEQATRDWSLHDPIGWQERYLKQGDHCRWCPAAPVCPKLKGKAQELAKQVFAPPAAGASNGYDAKALAETLDWLPILEAWIKNVREFSYSEAEKGHEIPNYKLVEKRATRKWRLEGDALAEKLEFGSLLLEADLIWEKSIKSPAVIEKLLPKDKRALLDELCVKESSGHTLVHQTDKREAVKLDAKSVFSKSN
jgi:hypothetical protein